MAATRASPSLTLLLGPAGTGKTLLLRHLAWRLAATGAEILLQSRGDLPAEPIGVADPKARRIVLIDEADRMDAAALRRLAQLGDCAVVLAGLAGPGGAVAAARATAVATLAPLPADEVQAFVAEWLAQSGLPKHLFDAAALDRVAAQSGGVPRVLASLMNAAARIARSEDALQVKRRHVDAAASFRDGGNQPEPSRPDPPAPTLTPAPAAAEGRLVDSDRVWAAAHDEYQQSLVSERQSLLRVAGAFALVVLAALGGWAWFERSGHDGPYLSASMTAPAAEAVMQPPPAAAPARPASPAPTTQAPTTLAPTTQAPITQAPTTQAPARMASLPQAAPARIMLRYAQGDAAAVRASALARSLRADGFMVDSQPIAGRAAAVSGVRYFFAEDRQAAETVMRAAGLPGQATLARAGPGSLPLPGLIELTAPTGAGREPPPAAAYPDDHQRN